MGQAYSKVGLDLVVVDVAGHVDNLLIVLDLSGFIARRARAFS